MMISRRFSGFRALPALLWLLFPGALWAQEAADEPVPGEAALPDEDSGDDEQVLEEITLPDRYADDDEAVPEEDFADFVFDEESQSYRLIEDDSGDDWVEEPDDRAAAAAELQRLFDLYREALGAGQYLEADTLAKQVVEFSIRINGLDSFDSAKAIANLGIAQHHNGDYESALRNFQASIDIIERIDNRLSKALINPLQGLAASQAATGRMDLAQESYERAVHVSHVNDGPHNPGQIQTLEALAELNLAVGNFDDASRMQESIFAVQSRNVEPDSMELIPALQKRAGWEHRLQRFQRERITWRQVINIIEKHEGKESLSLIPPLTNLGKSYLFVSPVEFEYQPDVSPASGESYLRRAVRIAERNPDSDWQNLSRTQLSLGDYYILSGRPNRASNVYVEIWDLLSEGEEPEKLAFRRDNLEKVGTLQRVFPPRYYNSERQDSGAQRPDGFETGQISFSYTVTAAGSVDDVEHIETQPREITDFDGVIGRMLRRQIFRPRMSDGQMVSTRNMVFSHEFYYRPSDLPEPEPEEAGAEETESEGTE